MGHKDKDVEVRRVRWDHFRDSDTGSSRREDGLKGQAEYLLRRQEKMNPHCLGEIRRVYWESYISSCQGKGFIQSSVTIHF